MTLLLSHNGWVVWLPYPDYPTIFNCDSKCNRLWTLLIGRLAFSVCSSFLSASFQAFLITFRLFIRLLHKRLSLEWVFSAFFLFFKEENDMEKISESRFIYLYIFLQVFRYRTTKKSHYAKCGKVLAKIWSSSNKYIIIWKQVYNRTAFID